MSSKASSLQNTLGKYGVSLGENDIPQRTAYFRARQKVDTVSDPKERVAAKKQLVLAERDYFLHYHQYVALLRPYLIFDTNDQTTFWEYDDDTGVYRERSAVAVGEDIGALLIKDDMYERAVERHLRDILKRYRGEYKNTKGTTLDEIARGETHWLHVKNGWLNVVTREFVGNSPDKRSLATLNVEYDPDAKCPLWDTLVLHLADGDTEQVQILQEFIGYCLTLDTHLDKSLILVGEGQSGKSTFVNAVYMMLGEGNACTTDLDNINSDFGLTSLVGKRLNWIDEMPTQKYLESQRLKRLVSGEPTTAQRKYHPDFTFTPTAKFIWTTNEMPRIADTSNGSYRRFTIVECNNVYTDEEKDVLIDQKLVAEYPGILNWALAGLESLYKRGHLAVGKKNEDTLLEYRKENSPLLTYLEFCFNTCAIPEDLSDTRTAIPALSLYNSYKRFSIDTGRKPKSMTYFGRELTTEARHVGYRVVKHRTAKGIVYYGLMPNNNKQADPYLEDIEIEASDYVEHHF